MTQVLTVRIPPHLLSQTEARAARLGLGRAKYVRSLIEDDLAREAPASKHVFASEDLIGCYQGSGAAATNAVVRKRLKQRTAAKREKNR